MNPPDKSPKKRIPKAIQDDIDSRKMRELVGTLGRQAEAMNRARNYARLTATIAHIVSAIFSAHGTNRLKHHFPSDGIAVFAPASRYRVFLKCVLDSAEVLGITVEPWLVPENYKKISLEFTYVFVATGNHRVDVVIENTDTKRSRRNVRDDLANNVVDFSIYDIHNYLPLMLPPLIEMGSKHKPYSIKVKMRLA